MHGIYKLKEMLCDELEEYGTKGGALSTGSLDVVDKLAHTIKNLDKIIEVYEEGEDGYSGNYMYDDGRSMEGRTMGENRSYARGRGRNARRDSRGRYSSDGYSRTGDMVDKLRNLADEAPTDQARMEIQRLVSKMETMM